MHINSTDAGSNPLADFLQNLSNVARKSGSTSNASATGTPASSAQYFNQLINQISQNLQISGGMNMGNAASKSSSLLSKL